MKKRAKFKLDQNLLKQILIKHKPKFRLNKIAKGGKQLLCFSLEILKFILATQAAMIMPGSNSLYKMERNRDDFLDEIAKWRLRRSLKNLHQQGYIKNSNKNFKLTRKGYDQALFLLIHNLYVPIPKKWDGKWRIVIFDLPTKFSGDRNFLRRRLAGIGFIQIQKSVWGFPFPCEKEINFLIDLTDVKPFVYFLTAKIKNDKELIKYFKKIYPLQFRKK